FNFNDNPVRSYGTKQDVGTATVLEVGNTIFMEGNAWQKIDFPYTITPDTWISFWFKSTQQGEVHGLGFDDNDVISSNLTFRLYGTQSWGRPDFDDYPGNGEWKYYEINVGDYYVGDAAYFFFAADHDVGARNGNSYFRGVVVSEGAPCRPANLLAPEVPLERSLELRPNPVDSRLRITLPATATGAIYRVLDLSGRVVLSGRADRADFELAVTALPVGTYVFRYDNGKEGESRKFTVAR
ncbi:MAG: T9SS type A sorting domain-containing protein, partial [Bacteroidota bacterium]